jgi:transposase
MVEAIIWRYRTGVPWRDLPAEFGPWQSVWKRHKRFSADGTWDRIHAALLSEADASGVLDWSVSVDSTINRAHQHATTFSRVEGPVGRRRAGDTGGGVESQESAAGTG